MSSELQSRWCGDEKLVVLRTHIDECDEKIAKLLNDRFTIMQQMADVKQDLGVPVQDTAREDAVIEKVCQSTPNQRISDAITNVYRSIMSQSRSLQNLSISQPAQKPLSFPTVLIVGLGLIGGAMARQIKRQLPDTSVIAVDKAGILEEAILQGVIDAGQVNLAQAVENSSLIVLAANPETNLNLLKEVAQNARQGQVIVDLTSTKTEICKLAEKLDFNGASFIGGHPCFGSEKSGFAASAELNPEGFTFCLVPTTKSSEIPVKRLTNFFEQLKFKVLFVDAQTHDQTFAELSHVVQLLAVILGDHISGNKSDEELENMLRFAGPSFRQFARLMKSPFGLWNEIVSQNRQAIVSCLKDIRAKVGILIQALESGDSFRQEELLSGMFENAERVHRLLKT